MSSVRTRVLGLAGGTGCGKSHLARGLVKSLGPDQVAVLSHDAYYRDLSHLPIEERERTDFDHPDSLETELLLDHLDALRAGRSIQVPKYRFHDFVREPHTTTLHPAPWVVIDGLLVLAVPELAEACDLKVFIDVPADLRLIRRIRRDQVVRNYTVEQILERYLENARPAHEALVEPSKAVADHVIENGDGRDGQDQLIRLVKAQGGI